MIATLGVVSDTPEGRFFFRGLASAAEFERDLISARTREGMAAAMRRGRHVGRPANTSREQLLTIRDELRGGQDIAMLAKTYRLSETVLRRRLKAHGFLSELELSDSGGS
jgi:DNA invertase Pin-like site-specific DNA recombinase